MIWLSVEGQKGNGKGRVGNGLLSHAVARILPWALAGLTAGFGMGPGVPPPLISPTQPCRCPRSTGEARSCGYCLFVKVRLRALGLGTCPRPGLTR